MKMENTVMTLKTEIEDVSPNHTLYLNDKIKQERMTWRCTRASRSTARSSWCKVTSGVLYTSQLRQK